MTLFQIHVYMESNSTKRSECWVWQAMYYAIHGGMKESMCVKQHYRYNELSFEVKLRRLASARTGAKIW